jgi:hypothetical protein
LFVRLTGEPWSWQAGGSFRFVGDTLHVNATPPVKPPVEDTVMIELPVLPALTVAEEGFGDRVNPPLALVTVTITVVVFVTGPGPMPVTVTV